MIDFCSVVVPGSLIAAPGSVVSVFVSVKLTVVSAPGASGPYGFDVASSVKSAGAVIVTVPLCVVVDQLWTSTGNVIVSPMPIDWIAAERPSRLRLRRACRSASCRTRAHLPQRWKRPSTAGTTRTTLSV